MKPTAFAAHAASDRWLVLGAFVASTAINYLDRQTLATVAPLLRAEFRLSNADYGLILAAFSACYAASAPFAGLLIDRIGLHRAIALAVGAWSCAGVATGFTRGLSGLVTCRSALGIAEAAGIPAAAKAIHGYLLPGERALGNALNQVGVSLGLIVAPPLATWIAVRYGWRCAFVATGALGLIWIPIWHRVSRRTAMHFESATAPGKGATALLREPRVWALVLANALSMIPYSLWTNWTTLYLVETHRLTLVQAAWYAWIPPVFAALGGVAGGWLSLRWMALGANAVSSRTRVCGVAAVAALITALVPAMHSAAFACALISLSIFAVAAFSVNLYTLPLDIYGGARAAFAVSILVASYGAAQAAISPVFGFTIDRYGYAPVCLLAAVMPLLAFGVLKRSEPRRP